MNLSEIRDLIRAEANIEGLGEYTNLIDALVNEELGRLTGTAPYAELITETVLTSLVDATFEFALPVDFQILDRIVFVPNAANPASYGSSYTLDKGLQRGYLTQIEGRPLYYRRFGTKVRVYPYTQFYANDSLNLSYYKRPVLTLDTDLFPVESLIPPVRQYVMARMLAMTDTKKAQYARGNANTALIAARAENAGN